MTRSIHAYVLLVAIVSGGFWAMDNITAPPEAPRRAAPGDSGGADDGTVVYHGHPRRMFVFVIDSLRFQTATDPERMPYLSSMRARSAHLRMNTTRDAITVQALRGAFTGSDRVSVFGVIKNFWHRAEGFESLFSQLREDGLRVLVYSDGSFDQFGDDLPERRSIWDGSGYRVQRHNRAVEAALDEYLSGDWDVVIAHITYSDGVAHEAGIHGDSYRDAFLMIDGIVQGLDEAVPADEMLVVMGDHGHDEIGRHQMGLDVPTFGMFRGPGYRPDTDLGTAPITDTRYLIGWGLEVPVVASYRAGRHPDALVPAGAIPASYAAVEVDDADDETSLVRGRSIWIGLVALVLSLAAALWTAVARGTGGAAGAAAAWITVVTGTLLPWQPAGAAVACLIGVAAAIRLVAGAADRRREANWVAGTAVATLAFLQWGYLTSVGRPLFHYPEYPVLVAAWLVVFVAGLVVTLRRDGMTAAWLLLAGLGLLLFPTAYRYGSVSIMAPVWLSGLVYLAVARMRRRRADGASWRTAVLDAEFWWLLPVLLLIGPFLLGNSMHFRFESWPLGEPLWAMRLGSVPAAGVVLAFAAKLVVFVRMRGGIVAIVAGVAGTVIVAVAEIGGFGLSAAGSLWWVYGVAIGIAAACAVVAGLLRRPELARIATLVGLYLATIYSIRLYPASYLWLDCLLAALVLTVRLLAAAPARDGVFFSRAAWVMLLGLLAVGWSTLAWTLHRLDWGFLYDLFPAEVVELNVAYFLPPIVGRFWIPVVLMRLVVVDAWPSDWAWPGRALSLMLGFKALSLLVVTCGIGLHHTESDVYLEAVQQTAIWTILAAPLFLPPLRARKRVLP